MIWHSSSVEEVLGELKCDENQGLANGVVDEGIEIHGYNIISKYKKHTFFERFIGQLKNKIVITLIVAAIISMIISIVYNQVNAFSALLIIAIVIINSLISAYHIYNCDKSFENINMITNPTASVLREGVIKSVNSANLVPGDIIILESGDYIPADARIISSNEFRCSEIAISDIDVPVEKDGNVVLEDITPIEKRANMVFSGCFVVHGTAKAVVCATGLNTEIGRTSSIMQQTGEDKLPLESQLKNIGKIINTVILIICLFVFILGVLQNFSAINFADMTLKMFVNSVALAVAAIPEGLPAITSIVVAIGITAIIKDKIIIKDISAAELLCKTHVICCDKTGIFTKNNMTLTHIFDGKQIIDLSKDTIDEQGSLILKFATACTTLENDSTEYAIEKASIAYNSMSYSDVSSVLPRITNIPFDSVRKCMTVITMINEKPYAIVKGAPEVVIPKCVNCDIDSFLKVNEALTTEALRVVCIAIKSLDSIPANPKSEDIENELTFVGLLALEDLPRDNIENDIKICQDAGIKVVMVTGDNLSTAKSVAMNIGVFKDGDIALSGDELSEMNDEELSQIIENCTVFARISPQDKIRIINAWQSKNKIITITGDSVHDAEALALADVGCAIGKFGASVARGNADIIIGDNHFDSVVSALKESRGIFANIKKSVSYLFSCNFAEILTVIFGMILFGKTPIAAVQLLWINLLTDCAPSISLSTDRAVDEVMKNKPLSSIGKILNKRSNFTILFEALFITIITLISYILGNDFGSSVTSSTMAFATLGISQIFHCYNNKFEGTIFNKNLFLNKFMNMSVGVTLFIMLFLILTPAGALFGLEILSFGKLLICVGLSALIIPFSELLKIIKNKI